MSTFEYCKWCEKTNIDHRIFQSFIDPIRSGCLPSFQTCTNPSLSNLHVFSQLLCITTAAPATFCAVPIYCTISNTNRLSLLHKTIIANTEQCLINTKDFNESSVRFMCDQLLQIVLNSCGMKNCTRKDMSDRTMLKHLHVPGHGILLE